ncbi:MAG: response regulator transcription factor [Colwellia sp.]|nr:response regulator transcription factor [Colwellia sp.]MCW8864217.1 response regulator transcription factor [Colwellia sp.]MCW9082557.1 response regulator transcription factor [Colwellia sp.]
MNKKQILLIDDDHELAELLVDYLAQQGFIVHCCFDGQSGLEQAYNNKFDLILLDVMMPKLDGFEVLKALGKEHKTPVLMLTAKGDNNDKVRGLELGADDYLAKPFHHQELLARINAILRRIQLVNQQHQQALQQDSTNLLVNNIELNHATRTAYCHNNIIELTGTEYQILTLLLDHHGQIISKDTISEQVLGRKLSPFDRSIDVHVGNIRRKFLPYCAVEKIKTVRGAGYLFLTGEDS